MALLTLLLPLFCPSVRLPGLMSRPQLALTERLRRVARQILDSMVILSNLILQVSMKLLRFKLVLMVRTGFWTDDQRYMDFGEDDIGEIFPPVPSKLIDWLAAHPNPTQDPKWAAVTTCREGPGNGVPIAHVPVTALTATQITTITMVDPGGVVPTPDAVNNPPKDNGNQPPKNGNSGMLGLVYLQSCFEFILTKLQTLHRKTRRRPKIRHLNKNSLLSKNRTLLNWNSSRPNKNSLLNQNSNLPKRSSPLSRTNPLVKILVYNQISRHPRTKVRAAHRTDKQNHKTTSLHRNPISRATTTNKMVESKVVKSSSRPMIINNQVSRRIKGSTMSRSIMQRVKIKTPRQTLITRSTLQKAKRGTGRTGRHKSSLATMSTMSTKSTTKAIRISRQVTPKLRKETLRRTMTTTKT